MSLSRFLIRGFPDPVTESLSFWKVVYQYGVDWVKKLAAKVGNPKLAPPTTEPFKKLVEDPTGLNIKGSVNPTTMIKEEIKSALMNNSGSIKNNIMKTALQYLRHNEGPVYGYLRSITPLFPRFLSEFLSASYLGIVQSLVGLFQNSKTIRTTFTKKIDGQIKTLIVKSEFQTIECLVNIAKSSTKHTIWKCSSSRADKLRRESWGSNLHGANVP
ncbi:unnamed protein product [Leptidea sinapis]|uniref:RdRp catalytic domain-containing protein n=1 Tax=Leptidea sinapis TaxID=189913 RepID=A0A5E4PPL6_9NEOP|nr:unnamed protein product [Leptidea sinapis]